MFCIGNSKVLFSAKDDEKTTDALVSYFLSNLQDGETTNNEEKKEVVEIDMEKEKEKVVEVDMEREKDSWLRPPTTIPTSTSGIARSILPSRPTTRGIA